MPIADVISYAKETAHSFVKSRWLPAAGIVFGSFCALRIYCTYSAGMCKCATNLTGKLVVITGGNTGIGKATAMELARHGAKVVIASRNTEAGTAAAQEIRRVTGNENVEFRKLDLCSFASVREFAQRLKTTDGRLDILINNAGITGPGTNKMQITEDMCEYIMQCNYFGHFLLTHCVLDLLKQSAPSRIINVSSAMHKWSKLDMEDLNSTKKYNPVAIYNNTKLANVLFTVEMAKRLKNTVLGATLKLTNEVANGACLPVDLGVTVNVLHPGVVKTDLVKNTPFLEALITRLLFGLVGKTPLQGAQTSIHLALAPKLEDVSGRYFSDCKERKLANLKETEHLAYQLYRMTLKIVKIRVPEPPLEEDEEPMPPLEGDE